MAAVSIWDFRTATEALTQNCTVYSFREARDRTTRAGDRQPQQLRRNPMRRQPPELPAVKHPHPGSTGAPRLQWAVEHSEGIGCRFARAISRLSTPIGRREVLTYAFEVVVELRGA